jgi:hypothetical protein
VRTLSAKTRLPICSHEESQLVAGAAEVHAAEADGRISGAPAGDPAHALLQCSSSRPTLVLVLCWCAVFLFLFVAFLETSVSPRELVGGRPPQRHTCTPAGGKGDTNETRRGSDSSTRHLWASGRAYSVLSLTRYSTLSSRAPPGRTIAMLELDGQRVSLQHVDHEQLNCNCRGLCR